MWHPKCHRSLTLFNLAERLIAIRWMEPLKKSSCCYLSMALATNQSNNTTMSIAQSTSDSSAFFPNIRLYVPNEDIRSNDVLFGCGSEIENHHGTAQFLRVVLLWKRLYKATRSYERKTELAKRVVSTVSRNRGRFLRPANDTEAQELGIPTGVGMAWVLVDPDFAIEKTRQALRGGHNDSYAVDNDSYAVDKLRDSEKVELDCPVNTIAVEPTPENNGSIVKHEPQPPSVSRQSTMDRKNANRLPKSLPHGTKWVDLHFRSRTRIEAENWIDITNTSTATSPTSATLSPSLAGTMSIFTNAACLDSSAQNRRMMRQRALERQCRQEQKAHQENGQLRQILLTSERQRRLTENQRGFQSYLLWCCGLSLPG